MPILSSESRNSVRFLARRSHSFHAGLTHSAPVQLAASLSTSSVLFIRHVIVRYDAQQAGAQPLEAFPTFHPVCLKGDICDMMMCTGLVDVR